MTTFLFQFYILFTLCFTLIIGGYLSLKDIPRVPRRSTQGERSYIPPLYSENPGYYLGGCGDDLPKGPNVGLGLNGERETVRRTFASTANCLIYFWPHQLPVRLMIARNISTCLIEVGHTAAASPHDRAGISDHAHGARGRVSRAIRQSACHRYVYTIHIGIV
jgi:hypothetical protein